MPDLYLLFSHNLTNVQIEEAKTVLKVNKIIPLPGYLQEIWSDITPTGDIVPIADRFIRYLRSSSKGDYILVEGDFGMTFSIVSWCIANNRIPLYATTKRAARGEIVNGFTKMTHYFKHVKFRKYQVVF